MKQEIFDKVKKFVDDSFISIGKPEELFHFGQTVHWLMELEPEADEAMRAAAYAHDIERAFRDKDYNKVSKSQAGFTSEDHLNHHQQTGARIIENFLTGIGASQDVNKKISRLISHHEVGGDRESDLLKDADSLSYFNDKDKIAYFIKQKVDEVGKDKVRQKFDWMFNRISSAKAKQLAKPMYQQAIKDLDI